MAAVTVSGLITRVIVKGVTIRVKVERRASINIIVFCLAGAHIVADAIRRMFRPPIRNIRVRACLAIVYPVVINMPSYRPAVNAIVSSAERAFTSGNAGPICMTPDRVVQRADTAVRCAGIHIAITNAVVITKKHRRCSSSTAIAPVKCWHV